MKHSSEEQPSRQTLSDAVSEVSEASSVGHPQTQRQAEAHIITRVLRVVSGLAVCTAGVALTVLPGPGIPLLLAGLSILAVDVPFAAKLRTALLARTSKVTKHLPRAVKLLLATLGILAVLGASVISLLLLVALD
jgi:hypothetical protein